MYLKSIKASGFKSFADKIDLEFNKGITAIVGPNGSGKSNIVDAIRWVLGEQSVKSLRGTDTMSDVIFTGSSSRDAQKRASVSLIFDNKDHYLNSDFEEIEIKRTVYITGENEYYINNSRVRLKDITNLFIDSGAGAGAFNIISQGNITDIVNSKPSDRRTIFESAAGVLKYKKRKEEALKKLDKTKENLMRVKLVIDELSQTVLPLKKQSEIAKHYLALKGELEGVEIALLATDITVLSHSYELIKTDIAGLEDENNKYQNIGDESKIQVEKLKETQIEDKISEINTKLISINEDLAKLAGEKQVTLERQKYGVDKSNINQNLLKSKEEELELEKNVNIINAEVQSIQKEKEGIEKEEDDVSNQILRIKVKRSNITSSIEEKNKNLLYLQNRIEIAENNILNDEKVPSAVRHVINNPRFSGVHDTIGNLIEIPLEYENAITTSLGASSNFIVVDNFKTSKACIEYLKNEKLGRATFFPLDTINSRYLGNDILNSLKKNDSFVGVASDLVKYDKKYKNIVENQLGNVIVVKSIDDLDILGKKLEYRYRMVSLDGEVMHAGGSVTGGSKGFGSGLSSKQVLKKLQNEYEELQAVIKKLNEEEENISNDFFDLVEKDEQLNKSLMLVKENLNNKMLSQKVMQVSLSEKKSEISGSFNILNNKLDEELIRILEDFTKKSEEKTILERELASLKDERVDINNKINDMEQVYRRQNAEYNKIQALLKEKEVEKGKLDVKLDNLLLNLSDNYNLTYEAAVAKYSLDMDEDVARNKVKNIKKELDSLHDVNVGSIEEYDRLSKRYDFLTSQENDLESASQDLVSIIEEMDDIMISKFKESFDQIATEFKTVFKTIFQGGKGELKLSDPDDLLTSGVDIIAEPPGKKINSTVALSGGEQSLTAICLLFSILRVRPVPFIILDEAEAALDEANVDMFGKYIADAKNSAQFILITHKKRMMEYADVLYGITMQESGVSKIVSAKLES
jgi:chromosome segregation protein